MITRSLSDFTKKKAEDLSNSIETSSPSNQQKKIGVTLRLEAKDWERLHYLSIQERKKIQYLLIEGLNYVLEKRGLPAVK